MNKQQSCYIKFVIADINNVIAVQRSVVSASGHVLIIQDAFLRERLPGVE